MDGSKSDRSTLWVITGIKDAKLEQAAKNADVEDMPRQWNDLRMGEYQGSLQLQKSKEIK